MYSLPGTPSQKQKHGTALVLVLSCLALLSILAVAFISSVSTEVETSSRYADSTDVKQISQTAVNMIIAQIQQATSNGDIAWSSQPGLIRTYDNTGAAGPLYKLYSTENMIVDSTFDPNARVDIPADWKDRPTEFVDLNQPILRPEISGTILKDGVNYTPSYPILDPGSLGQIKGFAIDDQAVPPDYSLIDPTLNNPAAMPVRWLYLLEDGSFRTPDAAGNIAGATKENPPIARVAFWTDDETCKVNINTAAGDEWANTTDPGSFMDIPRARSAFDERLASTQPVSHEYQRYPGHPASTYLSAVFPALTRAQIGDIIPRVAAGGSNGGSKTTSGIDPVSGADITGPALPFSDGLPLYASVDELRYVRSNTARGQAPLFTPRKIEESKFFLTVQSRAPELNLLNRPRVSLWPEPATAANRTSFDKTIAFCSTVAGSPYYFVRNDATSATADYASQPRNQELYAYLQQVTATPIPGFGDDFLSKYPSPQAGKPAERDQILTEIFDYIRGGINLIDTSTGAKPYAGNTYSGDLRAAPSGTGHVVPIQIGDTRGFGRSMTLYSPILLLTGLEAEVVPNGATDSNNDGYYKGPSEKAKLAQIRTKKIQALFLMDTFSPSQGTTRFVPNLAVKVIGLDKLTLDGTSMGFPASAEMNYNTYANDHEYAWGGYVNHAAFFFDRLLGTYVRKVIGSGSLDYKLVSSVISLDKEFKKGELVVDGGDQIFVEIYAKDATGAISGSYIQRIPLKFPQVTVPVPTVRGIYRHSYTAAYNPTVPTNTTAQSSSFKYVDALTASTPSVNSPGVVNTHYNVGSIEGQTIYHVTRALVPSHGDMRLVLGQRDLPDSMFVRGRGYNSPSDKDYNSLWKVYLGEETSGGMVGSGPTSSIGGNHFSTSGKLVPEVTYDQHIGSSVPASVNDRGPAVSSLINGAFLTGRDGNPAAGDWDTAMGGVYDGSYINKADEGERGAGAYKASNAKMSVASLFSPNRQVPSPGILGSLPTGVIGNKPWQTLLLCPNPPAKSQHPGSRTPPDHLWLDLFWMPVVEPYAISEPFSTAGKINLNYQIVPFTNIERSTGLQAVLKSTRVSAIPTADGKRYKSVAITDLYRHPIDLDETLLGFEERIANNRPFRSASEICDMFLVPADKGATFANIATWWDNYKLTGDNLREHPYTGLYSRLTTKSNSYTVHTRVQLLKKVPNSDIGKWEERKDKVLGEYRGAISIERYLDPNLASYNPADPLTGYRFRTVSTKAFTP